jgi:hypothetical protein
MGMDQPAVPRLRQKTAQRKCGPCERARLAGVFDLWFVWNAMALIDG